ncbi:hypothetical protein [Sphingobacterium humi]|uniref:Uncharacterized protein n=1 Tax=Sphingobacterium humi TaxID=1796905 RepID=A0A6N8KZN8_9SPHI|nr:hypothetical protein [Sphingobacterium humi]MVZ62537.1 hypothetical protein [Sphingobacterium humi]
MKSLSTPILFFLLACFLAPFTLMAHVPQVAVSARMQQQGLTFKSTYIWSAYFKATSNEDLLAQLHLFQIEEVFLSPGAEDSDKIRSFIALMKANGIRIYRLIGENSYVQKDNGFQDLKKKLINLKAVGYTGVHLDVEPHALSDYKDNLNLYTNRFNELIDSTKTWCNYQQIDINISIPMHTQASTAILLAQLNIPAYIMAYENPNVLKLIQRTVDLRAQLQDNFVWVLRTIDYASVGQIADVQTTLQQHGILKTGIYELKTLYQGFYIP